MLLHIVVFTKGFPAKTNTRFEFLMYWSKMLFCMCLLLERFVALRINTLKRPGFAVHHGNVSWESILKWKLTRAFRALERPWLFMKSSYMFISVGARESKVKNYVSISFCRLNRAKKLWRKKKAKADLFLSFFVFLWERLQRTDSLFPQKSGNNIDKRTDARESVLCVHVCFGQSAGQMESGIFHIHMAFPFVVKLAWNEMRRKMQRRLNFDWMKIRNLYPVEYIVDVMGLRLIHLNSRDSLYQALNETTSFLLALLSTTLPGCQFCSSVR